MALSIGVLHARCLGDQILISMKVSRKLLDQGILELAYVQLPNPNVDYCDFCVCTFSTETDGSTQYIERIHKVDMFWNKI